MATLITLRRTRRNEDKASAVEMTTVIVKLESINNDTIEIKNEVRSLRTEVGALKERVVVVEQIAKSLHKRVDNFEGRLEYLERKFNELSAE